MTSIKVLRKFASQVSSTSGYVLGESVLIDEISFIPIIKEETPRSERDYLTLSEDMRTVSIDFLTQDKLDEVRVLTESVPIPSAVWLLASGLIAFAGVRRKLRK